MKYEEAVKTVSEELDIPYEVVLEAYRSFWRFIRENISELPFKLDITEEEFNKLRTNFNIPSLGKLSCNYDRYKAIKESYIKFKNLINDYDNKES